MSMPLLNPNTPVHGLRIERLAAVVFDWAGTTVDFGSLAPVHTLQRVFSSFDLPIGEAEARRDMGLAKRAHIAKILSLPRVRDEWTCVRGAPPLEEDVEAIYQRFLPLQLACLVDYSKVIPGVAETTRELRRRGLKIGSTTGYTRPMLDRLLESAAAEGFAPDCALSPEDVGCGRPFPFMLYEAAVRLHVYPLAAILKVGDTAADIEEGLNAGAWSVGVAITGNMIGLSERDFEALSSAQKQSRLAESRAKLTAAGAHYVIDTLGELPGVVAEIERYLKEAHS